MVILLTLISCSNVDDVNNPSTQDPIDVYVAGSKNNQACYWKNNQLVMLDVGMLSDQTSAQKIIVSDNDVYVFGTAYFPNTDRTEYLFWKNNFLINLSTTYTTSNASVLLISDMEIENNDVYFVGFTQESDPKTTYWKNGEKIVLGIAENLIDNPKIKVVNNTIYITGKVNNIEGYYVNGVFNELQDTFLKDFSVNNNEVYVCGGKTNGINGYYKNISTGTETILSNLNFVSKLEFDMNNSYLSNSEEIYKNTTLIHTVPFATNNIFDFKVLNNNLYIIEGLNVNNNPLIVKINNVITMTSAIDEGYISLFIDQN